MTKSEALKHYITFSAMARAAGVSRQAVHQWVAKIPPAPQIKMERDSGGKLRADPGSWEKLLNPITNKKGVKNVRNAPRAARNGRGKARRGHSIGR